MKQRDGVNSGQTVLITGAGGSIGSALAQSIVSSRPRLVILLDHSEQNLYEVHTELTANGGPALNANAWLEEAYTEVHPDITAPTPQGGRMPVIPPPGSPGRDPSVRPK